MRITANLLVIISLLGCNTENAADSEDLRAAEAALAPAKAPALEHGPVWFGARVEAELGAHALHAWTFELARPATLRLETEAAATGADLDTVLYLYRERDMGWGSYLARNDDHDGSSFSKLERSLKPGRYRLVVKGPSDAAGPFVLAAWCSGAGCNLPVQPATCVFGRQLADVAGLLMLSTVQTMEGSAAAVDKLLSRQLVAAAQHGPLHGIATPLQLFQGVDSGLVRWFRIWDHAASRDFRALEFRVNDRSYGAIFPPGSSEPVAVVRQGALQACSVPVMRCVLGTTYRELRENPAYALQASQVVRVDNVGTLGPLEQGQLLAAVRVAYEEASDLEAALVSVDQGEVNQLIFTPAAGGTPIVAYEYGAGDNSYGGIFRMDSSTLLARINDGDLIDCQLLE